MRVGIRVICGLAIAATFLALPFHRVHAKTIYIAVSNPDMSFLSGGVAKYQGYFKDEGLDVEVLQMNANVSVAALAAGNVDYNLILQSVVTANLRGLPLKIAGILIERPNHVFVVNPKINRFADLKGKKIAVSSFGSLTDILAGGSTAASMMASNSPCSERRCRTARCRSRCTTSSGTFLMDRFIRVTSRKCLVNILFTTSRDECPN